MPRRKRSPRILIVNDDGIHADGLTPLIEALSAIGTVTAVVPETERSAESHSLTLHKPLRLRKVSPGVYTLNGSPADCTRLGTFTVLGGRVDLIASGINKGYNLGQDVVYSGTVAGAMEGTMIHVPSFAVSLGARGDFRAAAEFSRRLALIMLGAGPMAGVCLNVNVPPKANGRPARAKVTRLGRRVYDDVITRRSDPVGRPYYWIMGKAVHGVATPGTDVAATRSGFISVTPLAVDNTHVASLSRLKKWAL